MSTHRDRTSSREIVEFKPARLPYDDRLKKQFNVDRAGWKALTEAIFPLAKSVDSVALALSYCKARNLDPFKRVVHIVPMWDSTKNGYVDTIWPSIAELRITAHRTGQYVGCDETEFGPEITKTFEGRVGKQGKEQHVTKTVTFPEWARVTVYREQNGRIGKFVGPRVKWTETYATIGRSDLPNDMWEDRSEGQLDKCAEAAALRKAFPEELGNTYVAEEMHGRRLFKDAAAEQQPEVLTRNPALSRKRMTLDDIGAGVLDQQKAAEPAYHEDARDSAPPAEWDEGEAADQGESVSAADPADEAYKRGRQAFIAGISTRAMPGEFRNNEKLTKAYREGYADAKAETEAAE